MRTLLFLLLSCTISYGFKILVWSPTISRSHMISNGRIADALAARGHDVVLLEADFLGISDKINSSKLARKVVIRGFGGVFHRAIQSFSKDALAEDSIIGTTEAMILFSRAYNNECKEMISRDSEMAALKAENFDGFFGEQINYCGNGLAHALGIKSHFWISSCPVFDGVAWSTGMPSPTSYLPASAGPNMDTKPSYWQRVQNTFGYFYYMIAHLKVNNELTEIFREKFGSDFPPVDQIAGNSDVLFVATDEYIEFPRPILPHVVHIGGLMDSGKHSSRIEEPFVSEMKKGELGVVYFSLGTNVNTSSLPSEAKKTVVDLAKRFTQYHFIIKVDKFDTFVFDYGAKFNNVYVTDWAPQPSILEHDRLRVFITHAGYNGLMEAARAAVPLLTIPFMFDQARNSRSVAMGGWGLHVPKQSLINDPAEIGNALEILLEDERYKKAAVRIQRLVTEKPFNATERLVKTTEFVLSMGGIKELLVEGRNLTFIKYYNLDIFIPFIIIITVVLYFLLLSCYRLFSFSKHSGSKKVKRQ